METVLTIAGFDPSSGAGVTADLAVTGAHGFFGTACVTALTVQSTVGVRATHAVAARVVADTLQCLMEDLPPVGIKIGMLAMADNVRVVAEFLERYGRRGTVVLDPVMRSSSGRELLEAAGVELLRERLLPLVDWVTPNLEELGILAGMDVAGREEMVEAAGVLRGRFRRLNVVATGGHLEVPDDLFAGAGGELEWVRGKRIESRATHGTGCAFSSALLCGLVAGMDGLAAVRRAKEFVSEGIRRAPGVGSGRGPLELLWPLRG